MPLLALGQAFTAKVRLIVWCKTCLQRFEPDTAELSEQHGAATTGGGLGETAALRAMRCTRCGFCRQRRRALMCLVLSERAEWIARRGGSYPEKAGHDCRKES